jgi:hypothetical protein
LASARYYIGVADHAYVQAACSQAVCLFSGGTKHLVADLNAGDRVAFFAPKTAHDGKPLEQFVAIGTIAGDVAWQKEWTDWNFTAWVRDCTYAEVTPIDLFQGIPNWSRLFKDGRLEVSAEVFTTLTTAMGAPCSN